MGLLTYQPEFLYRVPVLNCDSKKIVDELQTIKSRWIIKKFVDDLQTFKSREELQNILSMNCRRLCRFQNQIGSTINAQLLL